MVDIVHHAVIGTAGAGLATALGQQEVAIGFIVGSILPDIDVLFMALGKARFLRLHQGVTHSLVGLPILATVVAGLLQPALGAPLLPLLAGVIAGMALHVALDILNTFGVNLLWPMKGRICLDAFFFIDVQVFVSSTAFAVAAWTGHGLTAAVAWLLFVASYSALRWWWRRLIMREHGLTTAVPSGVAPMTWFVTKRDADGIRTGKVSGIRRRCVWTGTVAEADADLLDELRTGPVFSDLERSLKLFVPVAVERHAEGTTVRSRCVAVPNFGNRYGETTSVIVDGKVINEDSAI